MATKKKAIVETQEVQEVQEVQATQRMITLPNRSALWNDANTASGYDNYIPAGTYPVAEVKNGFTLIEGKGWVHCVPQDENQA